MRQVCREKRKEVKLGRKRKKEIGRALEKRKERKKLGLVGRGGEKLEV